MPSKKSQSKGCNSEPKNATDRPRPVGNSFVPKGKGGVRDRPNPIRNDN